MMRESVALVGHGLSRLASDDGLSDRTRRVLAIVFLSIAVVVGTWTYTDEGRRLFGLLGPRTANFSPDLGSGLIALALLFPLYTRGIMHWRGLSIYAVVIFVLTCWVLAITVSITLGGGTTLKLGGFRLPNGAYAALVATLCLLYLGMRPVASLAAVAFFALAAFNLATANVMGIFGFFFLIATLLGILCQNDLHPGRLIGEVRDSWSGAPIPPKPKTVPLSDQREERDTAP